MQRTIIWGLSVVGAILSVAQEQRAQTPRVRSIVPDPAVISTRQELTPAGVQSIIEGRVHGMGFGADGTVWLVIAERESKLLHLDQKKNKVVETITLPGWPGPQGPILDGQDFYMSSVTLSSPRTVQMVRVRDGKVEPAVPNIGEWNVGRIAVRAKHAVVPLPATNEAAVVDIASGTIIRKTKTGIHPFDAVIDGGGHIAYVANLGGRFAEPRDTTTPPGSLTNPFEGFLKTEAIVVDSRGVPASGTVTRLNLESSAVGKAIEVGLHPTSLVWDE